MEMSLAPNQIGAGETETDNAARIDLRPYQRDAVEAAIGAIERGESGGVVLPTGSGKSVVIGAVVRHALARGMRVWSVTHSRELVAQNARAIERTAGVRCGVMSAGLGRDDAWDRCVSVSVQTLASRLPSQHASKPGRRMPRPDLLIIDEAHRIDIRRPGSTYARVMAWCGCPVISLTATPWRHGVGSIYGGVLGDVLYSAIDRDAMEGMLREGYLCPLITREPGTHIDVAGVRVVSGEYASGELQARVCEVLGSVLTDAVAQSVGRQRGLVYVPTLESAGVACQMLRDMGQTCHVVDGSMALGYRDRALADHRAGVVRWLISVGVLTTGYDDPAVDVIVLARPTRSTVLHVQILGRGLRPGSRDCLVLDYAGNISRLGPIDDPVVPRKRGEVAGEAPVRRCVRRPLCDAVMHTTCRVCPACGADQPEPDRMRQVEVVASDATAMRAAKKMALAVSRYQDHIPMIVQRQGSRVCQTRDGVRYLSCPVVGGGYVTLTAARCRALGLPEGHMDALAAMREYMYLPMRRGDKNLMVCERGSVWGIVRHPILGPLIESAVSTGALPVVQRQLADAVSDRLDDLRARIGGSVWLIRRLMAKRGISYEDVRERAGMDV